MSEENKVKTCFVIMPISDQPKYPVGHFDKIYKQIIVPAVQIAGFEPIRADSDQICDSIMKKILKNLVECDMAICDLSSRNPNVMYELGIRQAYGKKVVLVQDDATDKIFDVAGINTVFYKKDRLYENVMKAKDDIANAIKETYKNGSFSLMNIVNLANAKVDNSKVDEVVFDRIMMKSIYSKLDAMEDSIRLLSNTQNVSDELNCGLNKRSFARLVMECKDALGNYPDDLDLLVSCYQRLSRANNVMLHNRNDKSFTPKDYINVKNTLIELNDRINALTNDRINALTLNTD